jgi:hypothetical protein
MKFPESINSRNFTDHLASSYRISMRALNGARKQRHARFAQPGELVILIENVFGNLSHGWVNRLCYEYSN